jgi:prepilin-type N-terminal cleavage/methylation domain-containing protein
MRRRINLERLKSERGVTLIEVSVASAILLVVMAGLMGMAAMATTITENQGHLGARTTEYAVDKMEQLQELTYGDAQSDTTVFPSLNTGGTGLTVGGSADPAAPVVGYTDYLDSIGTILCTAATPCGAVPPATWYYKRVWQVSVPSPNLKQMTVTAIVRTSVAGAQLSRSTVSSYKTNCPTGC